MKIREDIITQQKEPDKLIGIAAILQSIPLPFVYWCLTLGTFGIAFILWVFSAYLALMAKVVFCLAVSSIAARIVFFAYNKVHYVRRNNAQTRAIEEESYQTKLNTQRMLVSIETSIAKLRMHQQLPEIGLTAVSQGQNFEYGGLKVSDWRSNMHMLGNSEQVKQLAMPAILLPAKSEMIEVARRHDFSRENIFLAQSNEGDVTTSVRGYLHCANDGSTDSGKTSNWRGQLTQFIKADIDCILLNPNFCLTTKDGQDWKPIARALESQGSYELALPRVVTQFANINAVLCWLAKVEIDRRFQMMREGCFDYNPLYAYIDEWPSIATECKEGSEYLKLILQRGRAVEVCVSVNSQGFLKDDTDLKGSARENFATAFFLGGSTYSGAKMLDLSEKTLKEMLEQCQEPIGKGVGFLRNNTSLSNAQIVRLPYADNDFLYHCLGKADSYKLPPENIVESPINQDSTDDLDRVYEACMQLKEEGKRVNVNAVTELVPFGRTKVSLLMKELTNQGSEIR
jgi:hypothetical protein